MPLCIALWVLMLIWIVLSLWLSGWNWKANGSNLLLLIILVLISWQICGPPIHR